MWEKGWVKRCVLHTVYEVDIGDMHENEKGNLQFCKTFVSRRCTDVADDTEEPEEVLCEEVETVKGF